MNRRIEDVACIAMGATATHVPELHKVWAVARRSLSKLMNPNLHAAADGPGGVAQRLPMTDQVDERCLAHA